MTMLVLPLVASMLAGPPAAEEETHPTTAVDRPTTIALDVRAVPTIEAESRLDAFAALGWLHATERFFQMDAMRRLAAGETAALVGPPGLETDRTQAIARRRDLARRTLADLAVEERRVLEHYVDGVNAGLDALAEPPIEHRLLNAVPQPWTTEDSILVLVAMFDMLQRTADEELDVATLREAMPAPVADWLTSVASRWDTLLVPADPADPRERPAATPPRSEARTDTPAETATRSILLRDRPADRSPFRPGSNSFAVAGSRTADGRAIVANDPHLRITAPGIWYRVALSWPDVRAFGLSLPGVPGLPVGMTDHLAWGLTNTTGDFEDLVIVEVDPEDPERYRTPDGPARFDVRRVPIEVAGGRPVEVESRLTRWGPVVDTLPDGRPLALLRASDQPGAIDLGLLGLLDARDLESALDVAARWGGPSQNVVIADADGRIGWTLSGWIPDRVGWDGTEPVTHLEGRGWRGPLPPEARPRLVDPPAGVLQTANNRLVPMDAADRIGRHWAIGDRASRLAVRLGAEASFTERDLLEIQLDDVATRLLPYRSMLLDAWTALPADEVDPDAIRMVEAWDGRADLDDVALPVISAFRARLLREAGSMLLDRHATVDLAEDARARAIAAMNEGVLLEACASRDPRLVPSDGPDWDEVFRRAAIAAARTHREDPVTPWGERNRLDARHPLSGAHPLVGDRFDLPAHPQPGHWSAVRVSGPGFGASARFVGSPGRWEDALLQTPGGQSGDPRSPHYLDHHDDWSRGEAAPLLPGETVRRLELVPTD